MPLLVCIGVNLQPAFAQKNVSVDKMAVDTSKSTLKSDSAKVRVDSIKISKSALQSEVKYKAQDSIVYDISEKKVYLYNKTHLDYQDLSLDANRTTIDWSKNEIEAEGGPDSAGTLGGFPHLKQGGQEYKSKKLAYNFKSKKGRINELITNEGEGYIHGETVKTQMGGKEEVIYARNAKYTTCDLEHPHFYIYTSKLKLIPKSKVITGPALLYVADVPLPLVIPFGFFPANSRKTSGIIPPTVGNAGDKGYVLRNLGFYLGHSDYYDLALTTDLYTGGTYQVSVRSNYAYRYHFRGGFGFSYGHILSGLRDTKSFSIQDAFNVTWNHQQDPKAHPGSSFSSNVNFSSSNYAKQLSYNLPDLLNQVISSSVAYSKTFKGTPFSLSTTLNHSQNRQTGEISLELPNVVFSMNRIYPFRSPDAIKKRWYHDIGISYNMDVHNSLNTSDSTFRKDFQLKNFLAGAHQAIPLSTSLKVFKYFSFTPSLLYDGYFYLQKHQKTFYAKGTPYKGKELLRDTTITDTTQGFYMANQWSSSASLSTILYGTYKAKRIGVQAIRHMMQPSVSAFYKPDFSEQKYKYYGNVQTDSAGHSTLYPFFSTPRIGIPSAGKQGGLAFSLQNSLEMKVRNKKDTTGGFKKVSLLDYLNLNMNYNFLADSFRLSNPQVAGKVTLFKRLNVQGSMSFDPYAMDQKGRRLQEYEWDAEHKLARFSNGNLSMTGNLNSKAAAANSGRPVLDPTINYFYPEQYAQFDAPWNLSLTYTLNYSVFGTTTNLSQNLITSASYKPTKNWNITANTTFDIKTQKVTSAQFNLSRDLHCWQMTFQWIPFGYAKSYFFNIHIKAETLRDLKFEQRRDVRYGG